MVIMSNIIINIVVITAVVIIIIIIFIINIFIVDINILIIIIIAPQLTNFNLSCNYVTAFILILLILSRLICQWFFTNSCDSDIFINTAFIL